MTSPAGAAPQPSPAAAACPDIGHTLLAIFAHPDDESIASGGLLAWCADRGARVSLLCVTRGGYGAGDAALDVKARRTAELDAAAHVLGLAEVALLDYRDGYLPWEGGPALVADVRAAIERVQPEVVVTFGPDGLYWHPDHIAVHEATTTAIDALGERAPALFYVTTPPDQMRRVLEAALVAHAGSPDGDAPRGILGITNVEAFGSHAEPPTLVVDATAHAGRKLAALRCHRTQVAGDALDLLPDTAAHLLGVEHYRRADTGATGLTFIERLG